MKLHHVGIIVPDQQQLAELMAMLDLQADRRHYVSAYEAECVFSGGNNGACIEFVVPTGGRFAKFNKGMGGLHHVAFEVDDLVRVSEEYRLRGIELLEKEPIDAGPIRINFLPPAYTRGFIVEFVEQKKMKQGTVVNDGLLTAIEQASARFPSAAKVCDEMLALSPTILRGQLQYLLNRWGENFWQRAEWLIQLANGMGGSPANSLVEYTMAYLKEQVCFMENGEYSHNDFEDVRKEVYDNAEIMDGFYLQGLMLTHAFWPIHFDMHEFFLEQFIPRVPDEGCGAEYGFGHGLYLLEVLRNRPKTSAQGYDISEFSRRHAERLLKLAGIGTQHFQLGFADVRLPLDSADGSYRWGIFAEIIEHIPDPLFSLKELHRALSPGAPLFATTVVKSNAIDHLYLFNEVDEVRQLFRDAGFTIVAEKVMRVAEYGDKKSRDPSIDVAVVCYKAEPVKTVVSPIGKAGGKHSDDPT